MAFMRLGPGTSGGGDEDDVEGMMDVRVKGVLIRVRMCVDVLFGASHVTICALCDKKYN
jgi:hypothetical protein